jgi:hypothetical protein
MTGTLPMDARRRFVSPYYATLLLSLFLPIVLLASKTTVSTIAKIGAGVTNRDTGAASRAPSQTPMLSIWAWERDEDLSFIDPAKTTVSYFAGMIYVRGASMEFRPRTQKLKLAAGTKTMPVFRIETLGAGMASPECSPAHLLGSNGASDKHSRGNSEHSVDVSDAASDANIPDPRSADYVVKTIVERLKSLPPSNMVQIDFDALRDERTFYTSVLRKLRQQLPPTTKISVTALGSWLLGDRWLHEGDADEFVAMLFSIGPDRVNILNRLQHQNLDSGTSAKLSLGISANETDTNRVLFGAHIQNHFDKVYIFNSRPWTRDRFDAITREVFQK